MRNNFSYCLMPEGDRYRVINLHRRDEFDYDIEWVDELAGEPTLANKRWREIVRNGGQTLLLLPNTQVLLQEMRLPPLKSREKSAAIQGLLHKDLTRSQKEWSFDYRVYPQQGEREGGDPRELNSVLGIDKAELNLHRSQLCKIGLHPRHALSSSLALSHLLQMQHPELKQIESGEGWNMVYFGESECFLVIGGSCGSLIIRNLPEDLSGGKDSDEFLSRLETEIERSVFFARQHEIPLNIRQIFLCGNPEPSNALLGRLSRLENVQVHRWRPEERFSVNGETAEWRLAPLLAGAVAARGRAEFNLMPIRREDRLTWRIGRYGLIAASTAALVLLPLIIAGSTLTNQIQDAVTRQQSLQLRYSRNHAKLHARDYLRNIDLLSRDEFLGDFGPGRANLALFLRDLSERTPGSVTLTGLQIEREGDGFRITIDGECPNNSSGQAQQEFLRFQKALSGSALLHGGSEPVFLEISSAEQRSESSLVKFKLSYLIGKELKG